MVSIGFLYFFLPVFIALYALAGQRYRPVMFLIAGVFAVAWHSPIGLAPVAASILLGWISALVSEKCSRRTAGIVLGLNVAVNAAALIMFSYSSFYDTDLSGRLIGKALPFTGWKVIGAGVFTLHSIAYSADVFRKKYEREKSFIKTACYIGFFPSFVCGPILRYDKIREDLSHPVISYAKMAEGIRALVYGFAEKLVIAEPLMAVWTRLSGQKIDDLSFASCWLAVLSFSLAMFFEFKAYSDIAKGLGLMAGFTMPENFSAPFSSGGFNELIKRYCSTVYEWCRDYIYKPLTCKRSDNSVSLLAMLAATAAGLLWIGTVGHYFIWGFYFLFIITLEYISRGFLAKTNHIVRSIFMNIFFMGALPLAAFRDADKALNFMGKMFSFSGLTGDVYAVYVVKNYFILFFVAILFAFGPARLTRTTFNRISPNIMRIVQPIVQTILLLVATAYLGAGASYGFVF